ncbi:MAG: hypothetical protein IPJ71_04280 [Bdellovibrionales bacterium]|nr:hypothetical protein [Bdellovibrionales bacterium]
MFKYINNVGSMVGLAITAVIGGFSDLVGRVARAAIFRAPDSIKNRNANEN